MQIFERARRASRGPRSRGPGGVDRGGNSDRTMNRHIERDFRCREFRIYYSSCDTGHCRRRRWFAAANEQTVDSNNNNNNILNPFRRRRRRQFKESARAGGGGWRGFRELNDPCAPPLRRHPHARPPTGSTERAEFKFNPV